MSLHARSLASVVIIAALAVACKARAPAGAQVREARPAAVALPQWSDLPAWGFPGVCMKHPFNVQLLTAVTTEERAALRFYQGDGYKAINAHLRGRPLPAGADAALVAKHADLVRAAIQKQKPVPRVGQTTLKVYRVFHTATAPEVGATFEATGLVSTTFNSRYGTGTILFGYNDPKAVVPAKGHMAISITIPPGFRGFAMNALEVDSRFPDECELLFASGARFRVDSSKVENVADQRAPREVSLQNWTMVADGVDSQGEAALAGLGLADDDAPAAGYYDYEADFYGAGSDDWYDDAEAAGLVTAFESEFVQVQP